MRPSHPHPHPHSSSFLLLPTYHKHASDKSLRYATYVLSFTSHLSPLTSRLFALALGLGLGLGLSLGLVLSFGSSYHTP